MFRYYFPVRTDIVWSENWGCYLAIDAEGVPVAAVTRNVSDDWGDYDGTEPWGVFDIGWGDGDYVMNHTPMFEGTMTEAKRYAARLL